MTKVTIPKMKEAIRQYDKTADQCKALGISETTWWRYRKRFKLYIDQNIHSTKEV